MPFWDMRAFGKLTGVPKWLMEGGRGVLVTKCLANQMVCYSFDVRKSGVVGHPWREAKSDSIAV